jgi:serine/threonine-protein kinase
MWQKAGSSETLTWGEAREYVQKMNGFALAGYTDWRLPTIEELASLLETSWLNGDLFIDPVFEKKQRHCWSLDPNGKNNAWKANFHLGFVLDLPMHSRSSVRLVRSLN